MNGQAAHTLNANRISALIPKPGEVEHWTLINGGGGWDHPIHLHFEEGVTINRGTESIPATELLVRKDVWRLRPDGRVKFQVRFGEFGGAYVNHCHNTVHEDFAMLLRYQLLTPAPGDPDYLKTGSRPHYLPTMTPTSFCLRRDLEAARDSAGGKPGQQPVLQGRRRRSREMQTLKSAFAVWRKAVGSGLLVWLVVLLSVVRSGAAEVQWRGWLRPERAGNHARWTIAAF